MKRKEETVKQQHNKQLIKKYKFMSPGRKQTWKIMSPGWKQTWKIMSPGRKQTWKIMSPGRKQTWKNRGENNEKQTDRQTETVS